VCEAPVFMGEESPDTLTVTWAAGGGGALLLLPPQPARRVVPSKIAIPHLRRRDDDPNSLVTRMAVIVMNVLSIVFDMHGKIAPNAGGRKRQSATSGGVALRRALGVGAETTGFAQPTAGCPISRVLCEKWGLSFSRQVSKSPTSRSNKRGKTGYPLLVSRPTDSP
jgi:hypothetical protein